MLVEEGGQRYVLIESDLRDLDALHANLIKAGLDLTYVYEAGCRMYFRTVPAHTGVTTSCSAVHQP